MSDYISSSDKGFDVWQKIFMTQFVPNATAWGIPAARVTALVALQVAWAAAYLEYLTLGTENGGGTVAKNTARGKYETALREIVLEWVAANSNVTDADRAKMGLTVESDTRTPVAVPATFPELHIDISVPLQHSLRYSDNEGHGKGKPEGVHGCEIWAKEEDAATASTAKFEFLVTCTKAPYVNKFVAADAGKKVTYHGRWVNTKGQTGPFGPEVHSVVVE